RETLGRQQSVSDAADELVELAMRGGAPDNITVVVAEVVETPVPPRADDTAEVYLVGAASGQQPPTKPSRRRPGAALRGLLGSGRHGTPDDSAPAPSADPEELRYAPQPPRRFRWLRRLAIVAVIAAVAWAGVTIANQWVRSQYYVGDQSGEVAVFRGVSQEIGPLRLSELHEIIDGLPVSALPDFYRHQVDATIPADSLADAERIVGDLRRAACSAEQTRGQDGSEGSRTVRSTPPAQSGLRCPEGP